MRLSIHALKIKVEIYRKNIVFTFSKRCLWVAWFPGTFKPIDHPKGKAWGLWKEGGEWFSLCGPLLVTLGPV